MAVKRCKFCELGCLVVSFVIEEFIGSVGVRGKVCVGLRHGWPAVIQQKIFNEVFLEWILQNKAGHLMVFTQRSILNRESPDVDENRSLFVRQGTARIKLHLIHYLY